MDSLAPFGSNEVHTTALVNPSTPLPREILLTIFVYYLRNVNTFTQASHDLSLVCREWKQINEMPEIWMGIFFRAGISMPYSAPQNSHQGHRVLRSQIGDFLKRNMLCCHKPSFEEISFDCDFSKFQRVCFHEDSHCVTHTQNEIFIFSLSLNPSPPKKIILSSNILSLCTTRGLIYCSLANGRVLAFSIDHAEGEAPLFSLEAFSEKELADPKLSFYLIDIFTKQVIDVLVDERWIITTTLLCTKVFDRSKSTVTLIKTERGMRNLQINCSKLYWTHSYYGRSDRLLCLDLIEGKKEIIIRDLPSEISSLYIRGNRGFYLNAKISGTDILQSIESFDLHSSALDRSYPLHLLREYTPPQLIIVNNLAILVRKGSDDETFVSPTDVLECIDLQSGTPLYLGENNNILPFSTSIFQETLLCTTEDKVVKMTFPPFLHEDAEMASPTTSFKRARLEELQREPKRKRTE